jgi:hypothetical protein
MNKTDAEAVSKTQDHCMTGHNYDPVCAGKETHRHWNHSQWTHLWVFVMVETLLASL